ncbi:major tail protein [Sporosarcina sp. E16_8]|uniref:major tail protein n=1 Tax=Sporosarcina sp. E16_8 TaxID=2789295 RepID=UPI001A92B06F|nr:major tail protein [Sporosarcina sp. E16_8]MBO0586116.1 phage tail protein [Sporosarcina sp. E16_8]
MAGVLIGLKDLYVAEISDLDGTFGTPYRIAKAIEAKVAPKVSSAILYADDGAAESASAEGETEIELGIDSLSNAIYAKLLGKTIDANGAVEDSTGDIPPNVALMFRSLKTNGKYRYIVYYKGSFQAPEESYKTKGETIEYNTPTIKGVFVHSDTMLNTKGEGIKRRIVDEDDLAFKPAVATGWFTKVYDGVAVV